MKEVITVRITFRNNSDASKVKREYKGVQAKHNGGKLVIATVPAGDIDSFKESLEDDIKVASYELPQ